MLGWVERVYVYGIVQHQGISVGAQELTSFLGEFVLVMSYHISKRIKY